MDLELNILHVIAAVGTAGCIRVALQEARGRLLRPGRLFLPGSLAFLTAFMMLVLVPPEMRQAKLWALALGLGLAAGAVRGYTMQLQVDHEFSLLRLPRGQDGLWIAIALGALAGIAVVLEVALPAEAPFELMVEMLAAAASAMCSGFLGGRAAVAYVRHLRAPHLQLLRL
jgi:hypothetical protein